MAQHSANYSPGGLYLLSWASQRFPVVETNPKQGHLTPQATNTAGSNNLKIAGQHPLSFCLHLVHSWRSLCLHLGGPEIPSSEFKALQKCHLYLLFETASSLEHQSPADSISANKPGAVGLIIDLYVY